MPGASKLQNPRRTPHLRTQAQRHRRDRLRAAPKKAQRSRRSPPAAAPRDRNRHARHVGASRPPAKPQPGSSNTDKPLLVLRHAIMQTNYRVAVIPFPAKTSSLPKATATQSWINLTDLANLPLTGLARKIFLRLGMLTSPSPTHAQQPESSRAFDESLVNR